MVAARPGEVNRPVDSQPGPPDRPYAQHVHDRLDHLTLDELAAALDVDVDVAYQLVRTGQIYGIKVQDLGWRIPRRNLEAYQAGRPQPTPLP